MQKVRLGKTELQVSRTAFGALPIQRVDFDTARTILRKAYEGGINFFDTARGYSDSEQKLGYALADVRENVILATKTSAKDRATLTAHLETCLTNLKTDYIDLLQMHNPAEVPDPDDSNSAYAAMLDARDKGMIRHIGITNHRLDVALAAAKSGLFETMQFPFSAISSETDRLLVELCRENDLGFIAMKALSGGLLTNAAAAFAFFRQFENVVPIWGIQRESELDEFLALAADPPALDEAMWKIIEADRAELCGDFCRGCGYCLPCPAEIPIPLAARIVPLIRRSPSAHFLTPEFQETMRRVENCTECGHCREHCPYELDTPAILRKMYTRYEALIAQDD